MRRAAIITAALALAGCGAGAGTSVATTAASASSGVPDACALLNDARVSAVLGDVPRPDGGVLERDGTFYGRTCLWGDPTGEAGAIGVQIGVADETGHDMVRNRATVLKPTFATVAVPGGVACMNVAVLPVGGMTGASIFFRSGERSVLVGVTGPRAGLAAAQDLARDVLARLDGA